MDAPIVFKMIVLGQQGVGKSAMLLRYIKGQFSQQYNVTVGVEFATKNVLVDGNKEVNLQIWDTAGQQAFRAIVRSFYKGISGVFLAFAIDNQESLQALQIWHKQVKQNGHEEVVFFMVGTKADLEQKRRVTLPKAQEMMRELGALFYIETSSKTNSNIDELFTKAAQIMYKKYMVNNMYRQLSSPRAIKRQASLSLNMSNNINAVTMQNKSKKCCK